MAEAASHKDGGRGLERDKVVTAALQLLDEVGFTGLTLRRLAERLNVKAEALYWHFENKQDLIDALAERIMLGEFERAHPASHDWRDLMAAVADTHRRALMRYRDGAQLVAHANMRSDVMLNGLEQLLKALQRQGFTLQQAMEGFFAVIRFTIGCVFEDQTDPRHRMARTEAQHAEAIKRFTASHPTVAKAFAESFVGPGKGQDHLFRQGVALILDGMAAHRKDSA